MSTPEKKTYWFIKFAPFRTSSTEVVKRGTFTMRGVRNIQARNNLAAIRLGDQVLFYHSQQQCGVSGLMEVYREAYPNPTSSDPRWLTCDFVPVCSLSRSVILADMKTDATLQSIALIRQPHLSASGG